MCGEPIWEDCKKNKWSGIVIEPIPSVFNKLKENYSYNRNVIALNVAVSDKNGTSNFYEDGGEASSLSIEHTKKHKMKVNTINVKTITLLNLWEKYVKSNKVDILNLDCEGYDHIILLSTDFDKIKPKPRYILYESEHIPGCGETKVLNHLKKYGYIFVKNHRLDTLVKLNEN